LFFKNPCLTNILSLDVSKIILNICKSSA